MNQRLDALETRVDTLQRALADQQHAFAARVTGWSCMASCGARSTQTTEAVINFHEVTGHGDSAAAAYENMLDHCPHGQIYERIDNGHLVGGEMKSVCLRDAESAGR